VTNLTSQVVEYFYLLPKDFDQSKREFAIKSVQLAVGAIVPLREASPDLLVKQLRASAAVPIAFDPVLLPGPDGKIDQYVDGGVTANTPIAVARALSSAVDAVLLSPPFKRQEYYNMFGTALGSFDTMQRRIMYDAVRQAVLETFLFRAIKLMPSDAATKLATEHGYDPTEAMQFATLLADADYFVLQPAEPLPASLLGFDDGKSIDATYQLGKAAGKAGFKLFSLHGII
jgi:predicted acylesterase/phospholipase RssA